MNKISTLSIATTVTGAFIGAGFVSGQELWQFFGVFGKTGIFTMLLSLTVLGALCTVFTRYCKSTERFYLDQAVFGDSPRWMNRVFCTLEMIIYFFLCVIMTSGFTALVDSFASKTVANTLGFVFVILVGMALFFGLQGLVRLFSLFIPLLVLATVIISAVTLIKNGIVIPPTADCSEKNILLSNPLLSCFLSLSYNFFGSVGILAPLSEKARSKKQLTVSSILGALLLIAIAISILLAIFSTGTETKALPMLEIAKELNPALAVLYAVLLSAAMFSCSFSSGVCIVLFVEKRFLQSHRKKILFILVYTLIVYLVSTVGFTDLISTVYPIFGYVGFALILKVVYNAIHRRTHNV
ncbi:MAG: hypothetical protein IJP16_05170 [Clostridia bacterium]|nr:hypothetical protein [Clostridia bacterium]